MRIPLIDKIRFKYAVIFATGLFVVQWMEHTEMTFAALTFAFVLLSTLAFNAAGGFLYPSGWFVFANATLTGIVGLTYKAFLGQAGQSHLQTPNLTLLAYCGGMAAVAAIAALTRKLRPKKGLLADEHFGDEMWKAAIGAMLLGSVLLVLTFGANENGSFLSILRQLNYFIELGILLGTFYEVRKSNGLRSTNWVVWTSGLLIFSLGIVGFSKQGLLTPVITWLITAMVAGHNFSRKQILVLTLWFVFFQMYLVPYSQVGRNIPPEEATFSESLTAAEYAVTHIEELRAQFKSDQKEIPEDSGRPHLYDHAEGFFDRLNMLAPDDALISYTADGHEEGLLPTEWAFLNIIPHFIWKEKPLYFVGNMYAREIGMIAEDNVGTGIAFSPVSDAYHQASFFGVAFIYTPLLFLLFIVMDSLSGDIRESPWGILFCVMVIHSAPEGGISALVAVPTTGGFSIIVVALIAKYVLPVVAGVITNKDRTRVRRTTDFKPVIAPRSQPRGIKADPAPGNS